MNTFGKKAIGLAFLLPTLFSSCFLWNKTGLRYLYFTYGEMTFRLFADPNGKDYLGDLLIDYKNGSLSFLYTVNRDFEIDFNLRGDITVDFFISDGENSTLVDCVFYYEKYMYDHCCPDGICSGCDVPFPGVIFNNRKFNEPDPLLSLKEGFSEVLIPLRGENIDRLKLRGSRWRQGTKTAVFSFQATKPTSIPNGQKVST